MKPIKDDLDRFHYRKILGAMTLLGVCLVVGVKYGIRYGWLAGHTHWLTQRNQKEGI